MGKQIVVNPVTRIEGHAKITLDIDDGGNVEKGHLQVLEIRGFEKLLQGSELFKMPQVTARLCGVCPAAHHLASVTAIENGLDCQVPQDARLLRELLYAGHMLHSHALSIFVLSGPDLILGIGAKPEERSVFNLVKLDAELSKKILRVRSIGQRTVELVGGRGVHPVTAIPGGMAFRPTQETIDTIASWGAEALGLLEQLAAKAQEALGKMAAVREASKVPFHSVALSNNGVFDYLTGSVVAIDTEGKEERRFAGKDYAANLIEHVMAGSYMKSVRLRGAEEKRFFVGSLARCNINETFTTPKASALLQQFRAAGTPRLHAVDNYASRLIEMIHCAERMVAIKGELQGGPVRVDVKPRGGDYVGLIEAPRGILIHDYKTSADGKVTSANFIVATQNNYDAMDCAITGLGRHFAPLNDDNQLMNGLEFAMRCYDPCLACATHTSGRLPMAVEIRRDGTVVRTLTREGAR